MMSIVIIVSRLLSQKSLSDLELTSDRCGRSTIDSRDKFLLRLHDILREFILAFIISRSFIYLFYFATSCNTKTKEKNNILQQDK